MYRVEIVQAALRELKEVPIFYRRLIAVAIEKQLPNEPSKVTKNRKRLDGLIAGFEHDPPIWELRVQEWRIFYDINEDEEIVVVRAIRKKPAGKTTGDII